MAPPPEHPALPVYGVVLNVVSNLVFLLPLVRALHLRFPLRAYHAAYIVLFSSLYHLCDHGHGACLFHPATHQLLDYVGAFSLPVSVLLLLVPFGPVRPAPGYTARTRPRPDLHHVELWLYLAAVTAIAIALGETGCWPLPFAAYGAVVGVVVAVVLVSWLTLWRRYGHPPSYDRTDLLIALLLGGLGLALFLFVEERLAHVWSWTVHAPWHVLAALALFFALEFRSHTHRGLAQFAGVWPTPAEAAARQATDPYEVPGQPLAGYVAAPVHARPLFPGSAVYTTLNWDSGSESGSHSDDGRPDGAAPRH